jgi:hypothetical protein
MILSPQQLREIHEMRAILFYRFDRIAREMELEEGPMRRSYMKWRKEMVNVPHGTITE